MFTRTVRSAFRSLRLQKAYAFINILGLSVGLACSFCILLWVQDERGYDRFHAEAPRLYQVLRNAAFSDGQLFTWEAVPKPVADVLEDSYAEITHTVLMSWSQKLLFGRGTDAFRESGYYASPAFFEVFSFPLVAGDPKTVLARPDAVVISERMAVKFFGPDGAATAVGQALRLENQEDVTVTGVARDAPRNSTLQFDYVLPVAAYVQANAWVEHWGNSGMQLFVRLQPGVSVEAVNAKIGKVIQEHHEAANATLFLHPMVDLRLYSNFEDGRQAGGRIVFVRIFAVVALFILLIACINFMNLATARSGKRAREIGVRKAVGATRASLVRQFVGESVLLAVVAFVLALGLVAGLLGGFNTLTGKHFTLSDLGGPMLPFFALIALGTGLLAGTYPALYLSSFNASTVLRGGVRHGGGVLLRKGLVVFQFALSILLLIGTATVYQQIQYVRTKPLGLDRDNLVMMRFEGGVRDQYDAFKQALSAVPGIAGVTTSSQNPLAVSSSTSDPAWEGKVPGADVLFHIIEGDHDFVETMRMALVEGRGFSAAYGADTANFVVNEQAVRAMGLAEPLGARLAFWGREGTIVGVVQDFHTASLYTAIEPTIIRLDPAKAWILFVRLAPGQTGPALAGLRAVYERFNPAYPFEYRFLDERFEEQYEMEATIGRLTNVFAVLAIFIACLGLFGLAAFTAEQRTKEIGIRKALGASAGGLVLLLSRDFIRLVGLAFVLTAPLSYVLMQKYLEHFAYRIDLGVGIFAAAGCAALVIAWLTVGFQSFRAAAADPVAALRTE